jgi:hypothetical protein
MPAAYKSLGQSNDGTTQDDLYVVPSSTEAIVFVNAANAHPTAAQTIRISHAPAGAADDPDHRIVYEYSVPPNDNYPHPKPIYMATTDVLRVTASSTDVTFTADGIEITP